MLGKIIFCDGSGYGTYGIGGEGMLVTMARSLKGSFADRKTGRLPKTIEERQNRITKLFTRRSEWAAAYAYATKNALSYVIIAQHVGLITDVGFRNGWGRNAPARGKQAG